MKLDKFITNELRIDLKKQIYKQSYYEFYKDAFKALKPSEKFSDNWHIKYLCDRLQQEEERISKGIPREKDLIINIPFRSSKSLICTVVFPIWCWLRNPYYNFICTSYSSDLALDLASQSRNLLYTQWFLDYFEEEIKLSESDNAKGSYATKQGGTRRSVGFGGTVTGKGGDFIICDDPINPKKAASEVERKNAIDFYTHTLYSRLNQLELGVRIIIMQRLHEEDLSGYLMTNNPQDYEIIRIPVDIDNEVDSKDLSPQSLRKFYIDNLFWSDRFTRKVIRNFVSSLGAQEAAGQLYQRPKAAEGNIIKREWFEIVEASTLERDIINHPILFYLDTAETSKQEGDATGIVAAYKKDNCVYIVNALEIRKEFHDLVKFIPEFCQSNRYTHNSKIKIEPKSSGKSVVSQLRATTMLNVVELKTPKDDKVTRLHVITPMLESRRVKLIKGNYIEPFLSQLTVFPNGAHDDMVDAFVYAVTDLLLEDDFDFGFF